MGQTVTLRAADGHSLSAYRAGPEVASRSLVVVQEIFGVNGHIRKVCDRFAAEGYTAIAPALFDRVERGVELGYGQDGIARGRALRAKLTERDVLADVEAAANQLPGSRTGIVGYCFGGTVAWFGATRTQRFAAASCWYGGGIAAARDEKPNCPVQMHFGEQDASIPMSDVEAIRSAQPNAEVYLYPGAHHGFGCDERESFSPKDYELAQRRSLAFFTAHIR
ncbi:MAG: dienelactone hydrolase family protein [Acetobacteraceae bacterium]|nr:dienelactone hydrolase family protein [Acetobacteraceae bacterium]